MRSFVTVTPPAGLPRTSIVSYRVISEDGVSGEPATFTVGEPTATAMPAEAGAGIDALIGLRGFTSDCSAASAERS